MDSESGDRVCTVVVSLEPLDDWYPMCGAPAVGTLGPLELPMCQQHADLFRMHPGLELDG